MDVNDVFGQPVEEEIVEEYKEIKLSPFDFINSINHSKKDLMVDEYAEKQYVPYVVNKGLSYGADTAIPANEMNSRPHLDKKLQYHFLINTIRPRKRFNKWIKASKIEAIDLIKEYYGYSTEKARQVLPILNEQQLDNLKEKLQKGGV